MSIETKKISDLEQLETVSEIANVLIEDGGSAKRFPAKKLGAVKTVNGTAPDENGNVQIDAGGVSSWNDLEDKPFGTVKNTFTCTYDEEHEYNTTLDTGEKVYYVGGKMQGITSSCDYLEIEVRESNGNTTVMRSDWHCEITEIEGTNAIGYGDRIKSYNLDVHDDGEYVFTIYYWEGMGHDEVDGFWSGTVNFYAPGWYVAGKYGTNCYIKNITGAVNTKIEEEYLPNYLSDTQVRWENIVNPPIGSNSTTYTFNYDKDSDFNVTLPSGDVLYYVCYYTDDIENVERYVQVAHRFEEYDHCMLGEPEIVIAYNEEDDQSFNIEKFTVDTYGWSEGETHELVLWRWYAGGFDEYEVTVNHEGQSFTISKAGWYATVANGEPGETDEDGDSVACYIESLTEVEITPLDDKYLSDNVVLKHELSEAGIEWNHINNTPFGHDITNWHFKYDEEHEKNVTLQSGEILYHVCDDALESDITHVIAYFAGSEHTFDIDSVRTEQITIDAEDQYQGTCAIDVQKFTIVDETFTSNNIVLFENYNNGITFTYEGETITLDRGIYILGYLSYLQIVRLEKEKIRKIEAKYLPKITDVSDAAGETVTAEEFNALLSALRQAGYLSTE
jgi:hypothetical protein